MAHTTPEERSATGGSVPALDRVEVVPLLSQSFSAKPYRYMLVAIDVFTKKVAAVPLASKTAPAAAAAWNQIVKALGVPSYVYSDDGSEFKSEFKQKLDYFDVDKVVSRGRVMPTSLSARSELSRKRCCVGSRRG